MGLNSKHHILCNPLEDSKKRFLLGKKGRSTLLAIALNPSTANENTLDPTSRNIEKIAAKSGCDGWWLVNLYPLRTTNPKNLPFKADPKIAKQNLQFIESLFKNPDYRIHKVLCCWGNHVDDHSYLNDELEKILTVIRKYPIPCYILGHTKLGNPYHPSPMAINRFLGGLNKISLKQFPI